MDMSVFGGGFFYKSFTRSAYAVATPATSGLGSNFPGPWSVLLPNAFGGRWMSLLLYANPAAGAVFYTVQLGLGAAGAEVPWQPTETWNAGAQDPIGEGWGFMATVVPMGSLPTIFQFPVSLSKGSRLSCRLMSNVLVVQTMGVQILVWD